MSEEQLKKFFRIFKLHDGFEVWVGKNSEANDLLSMKYSSQQDLWFHVRGTSGSHTILKKTEDSNVFPKEVIRMAASICAYFSKARNAKAVNVSYTLSKNVQKFKGAKSGSVIIKNEKSIKVEPKLPEL